MYGKFIFLTSNEFYNKLDQKKIINNFFTSDLKKINQLKAFETSIK